MPPKNRKRKVRSYPLVMIGDTMALEGDTDREVRVYAQIAWTVPFDITIPWRTEPGTATAADYVDDAGVLVIPAGEKVGWASLTVRGDNDIEGYESFRIVFGTPSPTGVLLQHDPLVRYVVIWDDD